MAIEAREYQQVEVLKKLSASLAALSRTDAVGRAALLKEAFPQAQRSPNFLNEPIQLTEETLGALRTECTSMNGEIGTEQIVKFDQEILIRSQINRLQDIISRNNDFIRGIKDQHQEEEYADVMAIILSKTKTTESELASLTSSLRDIHTRNEASGLRSKFEIFGASRGELIAMNDLSQGLKELQTYYRSLQRDPSVTTSPRMELIVKPSMPFPSSTSTPRPESPPNVGGLPFIAPGDIQAVVDKSEDGTATIAGDVHTSAAATQEGTVGTIPAHLDVPANTGVEEAPLHIVSAYAAHPSVAIQGDTEEGEALDPEKLFPPVIGGTQLPLGGSGMQGPSWLTSSKAPSGGETVTATLVPDPAAKAAGPAWLAGQLPAEPAPPERPPLSPLENEYVAAINTCKEWRVFLEGLNHIPSHVARLRISEIFMKQYINPLCEALSPLGIATQENKKALGALDSLITQCTKKTGRTFLGVKVGGTPLSFDDKKKIEEIKERLTSIRTDLAAHDVNLPVENIGKYPAFLKARLKEYVNGLGTLRTKVQSENRAFTLPEDLTKELVALYGLTA